MSLPRASQRVLAGLEQTAARALAVARARGAEHAEVRIDHGTRLSAQVREGSIELLSEAQSAGLSARVVCRGRVGTATTADHSPAGVEAAIARAIELAGLGEEDPHAEPPAPSLLATSSRPQRTGRSPLARPPRSASPSRPLPLARTSESSSTAERK